MNCRKQVTKSSEHLKHTAEKHANYRRYCYNEFCHELHLQFCYKLLIVIQHVCDRLVIKW